MSQNTLLLSSALRVYLAHALHEAEENLILFSKEAHMRSSAATPARVLVINSANRVIRYVKSCQIDAENDNFISRGLAGLAAIDKAQEALLRSLRAAMEYDRPMYVSLTNAAEYTVRAAKLIVNANIAEQCGDFELASLWVMAAAGEEAKTSCAHLLWKERQQYEPYQAIDFKKVPANPSKATLAFHRQHRRGIAMTILYGTYDMRSLAARSAAEHLEKVVQYLGLAESASTEDCNERAAGLYRQAAEQMQVAAQMCVDNPECCNELRSSLVNAVSDVVLQAHMLASNAQRVRENDGNAAFWRSKGDKCEISAKSCTHPVLRKVWQAVADSIALHLRDREQCVQLLITNEADTKGGRWQEHALRLAVSNLYIQLEFAETLAAKYLKLEYYEQNARTLPRISVPSQEKHRECWQLAARYMQLSIDVTSGFVESSDEEATEAKLKEMRFPAAIARDFAHIAHGLLTLAEEYHVNAFHCNKSGRSEEAIHWTNAAVLLTSAAELDMQCVHSRVNEVESHPDRHEYSSSHSAALEAQSVEVRALDSRAQLHEDCAAFQRELSRVSSLDASNYLNVWLVRQWSKLIDMQGLVIQAAALPNAAAHYKAAQEVVASQLQQIRKYTAPGAVALSQAELAVLDKSSEYTEQGLRAKIAGGAPEMLWISARKQADKVMVYLQQQEPFAAELLGKSAEHYALAAQTQAAKLEWDSYLHKEIAVQYDTAFQALFRPFGTAERSMHVTVATMLLNTVHNVKDAYTPTSAEETKECSATDDEVPAVPKEAAVLKLAHIEETDAAILAMAEIITAVVLKGANCAHEAAKASHDNSALDAANGGDSWRQAAVFCTEAAAYHAAVVAEQSQPEPDAAKVARSITFASITEQIVDYFIHAALAARTGVAGEAAKSWSLAAKVTLQARNVPPVRSTTHDYNQQLEVSQMTQYATASAQHYAQAAEALEVQDKVLAKLHTTAAQVSFEIYEKMPRFNREGWLGLTERRLKLQYQSAEWRLESHAAETAGHWDAAKLWKHAAQKAQVAAELTMQENSSDGEKERERARKTTQQFVTEANRFAAMAAEVCDEYSS